MEGIISPLDGWESFYVIVGSSSAALTGLQFVVVTLGAERHAMSESANRAFGTPTVVHFCAVLLISAILSAPWHALSSVALGLGACGLGGLAYAATVVRHARRQQEYRPVLEDWLWHAVFPLVAYAALFVAAFPLPRHPVRSLFVVGAVAVLLLFTGIHNAWDAAAYIATQRRPRGEEAAAEEQPAPAGD